MRIRDIRDLKCFKGTSQPLVCQAETHSRIYTISITHVHHMRIPHSSIQLNSIIIQDIESHTSSLTIPRISIRSTYSEIKHNTQMEAPNQPKPTHQPAQRTPQTGPNGCLKLAQQTPQTGPNRRIKPAQWTPQTSPIGCFKP